MSAPPVSIGVQDNHGYARVLTPASNLRSQVSMARELRASLAMVGLNDLVNAPITRSPVRGTWRKAPLAPIDPWTRRASSLRVRFPGPPTSIIRPRSSGSTASRTTAAFGSKPGLIHAIRDAGLAGEGPVHAEVRSDLVASTDTDPQVIIASWAKLTTEVAPRVAPVMLLVRAAAATDPDMASLREELDAQRLARMTHNADALAKGGQLREGVTPAMARDVLLTYTTPEIYELLVLRQGWSLDDFAEFIGLGIAATLL